MAASNGRCARIVEGGRPAEGSGGAPRFALTVAMAMFLGESVALGAVFVTGLSRGFSLDVSTSPLGLFWVVWAVTLLSVLLSGYVLVITERRLEAALVARWEAIPGGKAPNPPTRVRSTYTRRSGPSAAGLAVGSVLFFAESMTVLVTLSASYYSGFTVLVALNGDGEFWFEFPLILLAIPIAIYLLQASVRWWRASLLRQRRVTNFVSEPQARRWFLSVPTRPLPAQAWIPGPLSGLGMGSSRGRVVRLGHITRRGGIGGRD